MKATITKEELSAIQTYQKEDFVKINQLLTPQVESDIVLSQTKDIEYSKQSLLENIDKIKTLDTTILKYFVPQEKTLTLYQSTNMAQVDKLKMNALLPSFLFATTNKEKAQNELSRIGNRPVMLEIKVDGKIPLLEWETDEILVAPFTKAVNLEENTENPEVKCYQFTLQRQELACLSEENTQCWYENIVSQADQMNEKLKACVELENQNVQHYENIRKLEQLLAKHNFAIEQENYEQDTTEEERQSDLDDIARIHSELTSLKENVSQIFNKRLENTKPMEKWKKDVITYLQNECRKINQTHQTKNNANEKKQDETEDITPSVSEELDPKVASVKAEALENSAVVGTLLKNIQDLIAEQQNHARIAESMDSNYKALNNAFEMKNLAEELDSILKAVSNKIDTISPEDEPELEKTSKMNVQVSILLNYLNNAKAAVSKKITRFDEIHIIEENELKKEIAETIKNIRCEAELKKLKDDVDIIEDKSKFRRFIGRFTGRNKLDETMLDQIQIRQNAIKKTFKTKMPLSYNYSIHELMAEIEMFLEENEEDALVEEEINQLQKIKEVLKKNFVIMDTRVMSIKDQKTGKNLPSSGRKISKKEMIELDTYHFLNRYGYDRVNDSVEPAYQDTLASEIKRIVDYVKTSGVI